MSRVALVTGGSRGIGRAVVERFGGLGHSVAINFAQNTAAAEEAVSAVEAAGGVAMTVQADVGNDDEVAAMFEKVSAQLGPVEILVNNAGVTRDDLLLRMSPEEWDEVMNTNLRSVYLCSKLAVRGMLRSRWGRIISVGSVSGIAGNPGQTNYSAAKAGIIGFTKALAKEVGSRGITVNAIAPGFIKTDLTADLLAGSAAAIEERIALGRLGTPAEVASLVGYLASEEAGYVTGQTVVIDGGLAL